MSNEPGPTPSKPTEPVELTLRIREGARVRLTVDLLDETGHSLQTGSVVVGAPSGKETHEETIVFRTLTSSPRPRPSPEGVPPRLQEEAPRPPEEGRQPQENLLARAGQSLRARPWTLPELLFGLGLLIYLLVRFVGLPDYPIYFFSDEALPTVLASDLLRDNFVYEGSTFLPTFFKNGNKFSLGATVYLSLIPFLMFGESVWVVRGTTVLFSLLAAAGVGLLLKQIFNRPYWWVAPLLLSIVPAWFLHSRTGFETVIACSFFAAFLYFYLLYRFRAPRYLYHALIFGALTFYSYAPGQVVMVATGLGLLVSDFRYHWQNRQVGLRGVGLLLLLVLPYVRFHLTNPGVFVQNLIDSNSFLIENHSPLVKAQLLIKAYLTGLSPFYWYFPDPLEMFRHKMNGYGNILWITLPFAVYGLIQAGKAAWRGPLSPWRVILIALLTSPIGAAVSGIGITRVLFFVIPATILTGLGLDSALQWLSARVFAPRFTRAFTLGVFAIFALGSFAQMGDALLNGPFWHTDYTMNGMQYGARQVFAEIKDVLTTQPDVKIRLSPDWANGVFALARFFLHDPVPLELESLQNYTLEHREIPPNTLFVLSFSDYLRVTNTNKFDLNIERTILDPTGHPAFYFVQAAYVANIDEIFAQEAEARHQLFDNSVTFEGFTIPVRFPTLDMGEIPNVFDNDANTLIRTAEANPLVIEMYLQQVRQLSGVELQIGATLAQITVRVSPEFGAEPVVFTQELEGFIDNPTVFLDFGKTVPASVIRIEVQDLRQLDPGNVHLWEIRLR